MDRLSSLPEDVLLHILSYLPTKVAARTSLVCRCFRHIWEHSPFINLDTYSLEQRVARSHFVNLANRIVLNRHPPSPILRLYLHLLLQSGEAHLEASYIASLIDKAGTLGLRLLTVNLGYEYDMWRSILPRILSLPYLESLSLQHVFIHEITPSTPINLKHLHSLSINLHGGYRVGADSINQLVPQLHALEHLNIISSCSADLFDLKSMTLRKLKLKLVTPILRISAPSLEFFELRSGIRKPVIQLDWKLPVLRKAFIQLCGVYKNNVQDISMMLNLIAHVQELHLDISEHQYQKDTFHILLVPAVDSPSFIRLQHFHLEICFHVLNIEDLVTIIQHSPTLESLKLVHKPPVWQRKDNKKNLWRSRLPRNAERNHKHAYFENLHIPEKKRELLRKLIKK